MFPTLFMLGFYSSFVLLFFTYDFFLKMYFLYFVLIFVVATFKNKSIKIGYFAVIAVWKQFSGYGLGYLESFFKVVILKKQPQVAFPNLFFKP